MIKKILTTLVSLALVLTLLSGVYAKEYTLLCLGKGEKVDFSKCNSWYQEKTCDSSLCTFCAYIGSKGFYCPATANPNPCNKIGLFCGSAGENATTDQSSPNITVSSPNKEIYNERKIEIIGEADEVSNWYFKYDDTNRWRKICSKEEICEKKVSFKEGENNITIKAEDIVGNPSYESVSFLVDSKDPKIYRTYPKKGFADGNFEVQFKEENPVNLTLYYGFDQEPFDINNDCEVIRGKYYCNKDVNLTHYNGQELEYYFTLIDIAGNQDDSKSVDISVDTTSPAINNPGSFYEQGLGRDNKYIYFSLDITENNFEEVRYSYVDSLGRVRDREICSRLKDGLCEKKVRFTPGEYDLTITILDQAGNSIGFPTSFEVFY